MARSRARLARTESYAFWRQRKVDPSTVLYESFGGNGALCNPEALFRSLVEDPEFSSLRHVWALKADHDGDRLRQEFRRHPRVSFVRSNEAAYFKALATSGFLVSNATFPRAFAKRPGQFYLNTWHGVPLKKMGFDIGDPPSRVANVLRNFLHADYLLSGNPFMTEQMYERAHRLDGIFHGTILEVGSPRVDHQFDGDAAIALTRAELAAAGLPVDEREIVLVAPTWKGDNFLHPENDAELLLRQAQDLAARLGEDRYVVLLKTHQAVHAFATGRAEFAGVLVPNDIPTNRVLAAAAILVTDYSSIFFDFLASDRPIHFLVPDLADYTGYRGLYLEPATWPGELSDGVAELAEKILNGPSGPGAASAAERRAAARERFAPAEDGEASRRVIDIVFRGREPGRSAHRLDSNARPSLLAVVGTPADTEALAAVGAELDQVDLDAVDVTALVSDSRRADFVAWQKALDPRIRVVARQGALGGSRVGHALRRVGLRSSKGLWRDEMTRVFGVSRFDSVLSFTDEPTFWKPFTEVARGAGSEAGQVILDR